MFRRLDERVMVAGQIGPDDLDSAVAEGIVTLVNNRPDGEETGQPTSAELEQAAQRAGLRYVHIPVAGGLSAAQVSSAADAITASPGPLLFFCRSGTRSTYLWALARAGQGVAPDKLVEQAAAAGYDLSPLLPHLR